MPALFRARRKCGFARDRANDNTRSKCGKRLVPAISDQAAHAKVVDGERLAVTIGSRPLAVAERRHSAAVRRHPIGPGAGAPGCPAISMSSRSSGSPCRHRRWRHRALERRLQLALRELELARADISAARGCRRMSSPAGTGASRSLSGRGDLQPRDRDLGRSNRIRHAGTESGADWVSATP